MSGVSAECVRWHNSRRTYGFGKTKNYGGFNGLGQQTPLAARPPGRARMSTAANSSGQKPRSMLRGVLSFGGMTMFSRVFGLVRDQVFNTTFGTTCWVYAKVKFPEPAPKNGLSLISAPEQRASILGPRRLGARRKEAGRQKRAPKEPEERTARILYPLPY